MLSPIFPKGEEISRCSLNNLIYKASLIYFSGAFLLARIRTQKTLIIMIETEQNYIESDLTQEIIGCFYEVYHKLGFGFLEKVYHNALIIELEKKGFEIESQKPISVYYNKRIVGEYYVDIVVNKLEMLEIKAHESLIEAHEVQLINYLKATSYEIGLLLNFGRKAEIRRKVFANFRKRN